MLRARTVGVRHQPFETICGNKLTGSVNIDPATVFDRRCETVDGVPVDPRQAVALVIVGQVRRIVPPTLVYRMARQTMQSA